ncbi:MAG: PhzF family phenazine biosynthesis protein [Cyanothece sp. SIO2G6]|nr:PhzF family phenazine biosynthesis protein [Cyanothece sp. SIO2G6]
MKLPIYQVDAFASQLFSGNPAAVVVLESMLDSRVMQAIAAENNLSETAFITPDANTYQIRWFTPSVEVDLCGHATLAAAHVVFNHLHYPQETVTFSSSKSGLLTVHQQDSHLYLNFPADILKLVPVDDAIVATLTDALGTKILEVYRGRDDYLVIVAEEDAIATLTPDMDCLKTVPARGIIVSASGTTIDFVSRFFAPQSGIPEDPVTGSAHTTLVPYWSQKLGKMTLLAQQLSQRGGELMCQNLGDRIEIGGTARTYLVGEIWMDGETSSSSPHDGLQCG